MARTTTKRTRKMDAELAVLFGDVTVRIARMVDPVMLALSADLMDRVHDGADALLARSGRPDAQRRYVAGLPSDVRLILCMWMMDLDLAAKLTARAARS
jgi:hypothetical protein